MNAENDSTVEVKEVKSLCTKERFLVTKNVDYELKANDLQNGEKKDNTLSKDGINLDEYTTIPTNENIEISVLKIKKMRINKALIPLRAAQFLWFASGSICSQFFTLILTHRGLTLKEFSVVFSMLFVFQLVLAYISGIIADKLGNGKPVLLLQMLVTILVLIGLLLSPSMNEKSCIAQYINETCYHIYNFTSQLEYCKYVCSKNSTDYFLSDREKNYTSDLATFSKEKDFRSFAGVLEDVFNSNETAISCDESCFCLDLSAYSCFSAPKDGLRLLYAVLILSFFSFFSTCYRFLDFSSLNAAKKYKSDFGNERAFGILGVLFATTLCNFILNIDKSEVKGNYDNVFWFAVVMNIMALIFACNISEVISPPGLKLTKKSLKLFTDIEIMSLIFLAFVAGSAFTFNNFFNVLFLDRLKATKIVIGFYIMTGSLYGLPIYLTSKCWLRKLDMNKIVLISFLSYTISATCYSFLYLPWLALIIEITKPFSFHLFWIAAVTRGNKIAPEGLAATVNAVLGTVHFGIGRSFSVSVGSYLMSVFGARAAFRILAGFCLVTAILYTIFQYLRYLFSKTDTKDQSEDPEEMKSMREDDDA